MNERSADASVKLRLLIDTNVFIAVEPYSGQTEPGIVPGAELLRLAAEQGHSICVHQATADDVRNDRDSRRRAQRLGELAKYEMLQDVPMTRSFLDLAGDSTPGTRDHNDLRILAVLASRAATHLVSEDARLRRRASRAGFADGVLTVDEAVFLLRQFSPQPSLPPPRVERIDAYALDTNQQIFESLRAEYPSFDTWLDKVRADWKNRVCFVVKAEEAYAGIALLKKEDPCDYGFPGPVLKLATFKVSPGFSGSKYGELMLKAVFGEASATRVSSLYVEVFEHHDYLVQMLGEFGFEVTAHRTGRGELVMLKSFRPVANADAPLDHLTFHVRYGPPALRQTDRCWLVPIQPQWHDELFPDAPTLQPMLEGFGAEFQTLPWGNALRKAYLCKSQAHLEPGDVLLFYRSHDVSGVTAVGIVERVLRTSDPVEIITFVGRRTVYSPQEIEEMCGRGRVRPTLAILFRQDRFVDPPWRRSTLHRYGLSRGWPQTIGRVREEGLPWLHEQLDAWP